MMMMSAMPTRISAMPSYRPSGAARRSIKSFCAAAGEAVSDVEFLDDEAEGDDRETGASLGEKGALVGSVIGEVTDHGR